LNFNTKEKKKIKIFIAPTKTIIFTNTKAPIAHKTNSKEQYKFNFYNFNVSLPFTDIISNKNTGVSKNKTNNPIIFSINNILLFLLFSKRSVESFETNLFFLKNYKFFFKFNDNIFYNF
jgi:hypothetical protein